MRLIRSSKDGKRHAFECSNCEHLAIYKSRTRCRCTACGYNDTTRHPIRYHWARRSCGYTRLFPPEDIKKAMRSVYQARAKGVSFNIKRTFAGMRVTVTSLRINKKQRNPDFWDRI